MSKIRCEECIKKYRLTKKTTRCNPCNVKHVLKHRDKKRDFINANKERPCADCHIQYPYWIMQHDHVRDEKLFQLSQAFIGFRSWQAIKDELAKCEIVCANCHANRTYERLKASLSVA